MVKKSTKQLYRYVVYQETKKGYMVYFKTTSRNLMRSCTNRLTKKGVPNFWTIELIPRNRK